MLDRLQKYLVAVVAGVLALVSFVGVALSLTVWKPADEVIASVAPQHPLVMTRGGVLPLLGSDVTVTVKGNPEENVSVVLGTTADVLGWIGDSAYVEVIGIESGFTQLKTTEHSNVDQMSQSGADNAQSLTDNAQSTPDVPQSGTTLADELVANDMWIQTASGQGEVVMRLSDMNESMSIIAASDAVAPTLTLTWAVHSTNIALIICIIFATLFTLIAIAYVLRQILLERSRAQRAVELEERRNADLTQTQSIPLEAIQEYAAAVEKAQNTDGSDTEEKIFSAQETDHSSETETDDESTHEEQPVQRTLTLSGVQSINEDENGNDAEHDDDNFELHTGETAYEERAEEDHTETDYSPKGRHSANDGPIEVDPPETVPTDTGTIDLSSIRPGTVLPSRRALREARERGEASVQIDGHEFDTGLIPQIRRVDSVDESQRGTVEAHVEEYIHEDTDTSASEPAGGWRSMMSLWGKGNNQAHKKD